jgi:hypothetical protein
VSGAELAFELVLDLGRIDLVLLRFRVEVGLGRREEDVDAGFARSCAQSSAKVRGYLSKSSFGPNCRRLTKMLATTVSPCARASSHQRDVAGVQVAHGRDEDDAAAVSQGGTQIGDGGVDLHGFSKGFTRSL